MLTGLLFVLPAKGFSDAGDTQPSASPQASIEQRIANIEKDQKEILENQQKILEQLQHLKVLIRRS